MNIDEQLKQILKFGEGSTFFSFTNADGKQWLIPTHNMRTAMNLYQPSSPKGKLVKYGLPWLFWNPIALNVLHAKRLCLSLSKEMRALLELTFNEKNLEFSIFCGTPCTHQKITLQVSRKNRIIGYVKVSANKDVCTIFEHECHILSSLHAHGICNVPQSLYCGMLGCGLYVFIQTTTKTLHSNVVHKWTTMHSNFLNSLATHTQQTLKFEQTDFCHDMNLLEYSINHIDRSYIVKKTIAEVREQYAGKDVTFSAFHADFTPWNMFVEKGKLFVFDWEYARNSYPPYIDYFHFIIQSAVFEKHFDIDKITEFFKSQKCKCVYLTNDNQNIKLKCYLLAIISIYMQRERYPFSNDTLKSIKIWVSLLNTLGN